MKRILSYMLRYWYFYLGGFLAMGVGIFLDLNNPVLTGRIIDEVIVGKNKGIFPTLITYMILITFGRAVMGYLKEIFFDVSGVRLLTEIRQQLFDHIQSLSYSFFDEKNTGELMARVKEDAEKIFFALGFGIMLVVEMAVYLVLATYYMIQISPKLSILALLTIPAIGYLAVTLEKTIGKTYEDISEQNAELNSIAQENISGVRLVKAFAREKHEINKFLSKNEGYYKLNVQQARIWSRFYPKIEGLTNILPILVIAVGGAFVIREELTIGTLVKFSAYMGMIIWPMRMIGWVSNVVAEALASVKKIDAVYAYESDIKNVENPILLDQFNGDVVLKHVSLKLNDTQVLKDINIHIPAGKSLAIMGTTGSGKSSIVNLLTRFYDVSEGEILFDQKNIKEVDLKNLREQVSVVMQEVFLFSDTIQENIKFGMKDNYVEEHLEMAAQSAQAHEFITRMESQYETVIGEKGIGLSGGQKQRISIARAFAKKAKVIIFDDSTSALDMETEYNIQNEIDKLEGVTKIIIAHRISAVRSADEIVILDGGEIVERGTHEALIALKGRYYETYREQYEGYTGKTSVDAHKAPKKETITNEKEVILCP